MTELAPETAITALPGVGPKIAEKLAQLGLTSCADALFHLPLRYEDRTRVTPIGSLRPGMRVMVAGQVLSSASVGRARRSLVVALGDGTGRVTLRFFHFYANQTRMLRRKPYLVCYGEVRPGYDGLEMVHPEYTVADPDTPVPVEDRLTPIYPAGEGVGQAILRRISSAALEQVGVTELLDAPDEDWTLADALHYVHRPPPEADLKQLSDGEHPAQQRLALEELVAHRISMLFMRERTRSRRAPSLATGPALAAELIAALPFELTGAQGRVVDEIGNDLAGEMPMQRLLHGDVGAGKTVVAAIAVAQALAAGHQAALTAPTEILAEQHYRSLSTWFEPLGVDVVWLTGRVKGRERTAALEALADGAGIAVGTHALMEEAVRFRSLALVVIDEQHRFGVRQRLRLRDKGPGDSTPHQLIMSATPIPRTLAMTAYADLEVSVIDELPPGRKPIGTVVVNADRRSEVIERVAFALTEGRQVYWVCTLVEESDVLQAEAATDTAAQLEHELGHAAVGLVHGRMKGVEKDEVMGRFKAGKLRLLVATTVIEVGVDVPNASLMIIENAERLGLSQLHQLRGRVGRGTAESTCLLLYRAPLTDTARQRLEVMRETTDGFRIAQRDLELRGPGEVLGTRQTGAVQFRIADLARDQPLLARVGPAAQRILSDFPARAEELVRRWVGDPERFGGV
ncbi:MAG: ATP-dependent DNA helicase RecG [Pseudomonadota bacterium]